MMNPKDNVWEATQTPTLDEHETAALMRSPMLDATVMMVDDEPLMTDLIQAHLEEEGYRHFVVVNDPRQALGRLRADAPAVLLLDLMMPQLSGFDLLAAIRADRALRYTPVIVLTAATGADAKLRALKLGATDFLSKPVDPSELVLRVRNTLAFQQYHQRQIHYDRVTGLPGERLFDAGLADLLARRDASTSLLALFSITIPECRQLRESLDDASAAELEVTLGRRLERQAVLECGPAHDADGRERPPRVARLAPDQFALVVDPLPNADAVEAVAGRLAAALGQAIVLGRHEMSPTPWIGIAISPNDGQSAGLLRKGADLAASHARERGAARWQFSSPALNARSYERLTLGSQLRGAARRGELVLHYQPKVSVHGDCIVGVEALVRWQHPELGLIPPVKFITLAEELGIIGDLGRWVIHQACQDAAAWRDAGLGTPRIAVNVAKPQFSAGDLASVVKAAAGEAGIGPSQLMLELTESMLMDDASGSHAQMAQLKALGAGLSIDDFGTGYSSLAYLKRLPVDELKIDRMFVMDLPGGRADSAIVRSVIELGHNLGLTVTAEGVETPAQLGALQRMGCDSYQGFLFSRPVPRERLAAVLASVASHPPQPPSAAAAA